MNAFDYILDSVKGNFDGEENSDGYMLAENIEAEALSPLGYLKYDLIRAFFRQCCYDENYDYDRFIISKDYMEKLKTIEVTFDEGTQDYDTNVRRPYYQMRGKRISEKEAVEFIRWADSAFYDCRCKEGKPNLNMINTDCNLFSKCYANGMVHPNGVVGMNGIMSKYPNFYELFEEFVSYAAEFPFLDFVYAVSCWDEMPPEQWEIFLKGDYEVPSYFPNFTENLEIGVWVHDKKVEFLSPENAAKKYNEYEKRYGEPNASIYCDKPSGSIKDLDFIRKCLEANGVGGKEIKTRLDKFREEVKNNGLRKHSRKKN